MAKIMTMYEVKFSVSLILSCLFMYLKPFSAYTLRHSFLFLTVKHPILRLCKAADKTVLFMETK
jgi:hypothetical protein